MKRVSNRTASVRTSVVTARPEAGGFRLFGGWMWVLWSLIGWAGTAVALAYGFGWVREFVESKPPNVEMRIEWMNLPGWLSESAHAWLRDEIERSAGLAADAPVYDARLTERVGLRLMESPWIAKVERVAKQPDGTVRVWAQFRRPAAFVEVRGRAYLVDPTGVRLPPEYEVDEALAAGYFVITGVAEALPAVGQPWGGEDLTAALNLAQYLWEARGRGEVPFIAWIRAIDVANFNGKVSRLAGRLRLRTIHPNAFVEWGLPPGEEGGVEASASHKLHNLNTVFVQMGGQLPPRNIDIRGVGGVDLRDLPDAAPPPTETKKEPVKKRAP